jgi:predicted nucleic acid-binding protein
VTFSPTYKEALAEILLAGLKFDFSSNLALNMRALELAGQYNLPAAYDVHYLALAEREGCELWTADTRLWNSKKGKCSGVRWMSDYQPTNPHTSSNESDNS